MGGGYHIATWYPVLKRLSGSLYFLFPTNLPCQLPVVLVPPSLGIEVYWSVGSMWEHCEDLNGLTNNRAASELIVALGLVG